MFWTVSASPGALLFDEIARDCAARGMNLVGAVDADAFDATQPAGRRARERLPDCDTILLLGSGGTAAWRAIEAEHGALPPARPGFHPIDAWSRAVAGDVAARLRAAGCTVREVAADDRRSLGLRPLGEMVGFGTISPVLGHLLHPEFGPWVSLRVALLVAGRPFGPRPAAPLADFEPCGRCARPCVHACTPGVYRDDAPPDVGTCASWRVAGNCATGCAALRACPLGAAHRYGPDEEAFRHAYALFRARRWLGAGAWRLVPRFVRQRRC